MCNIMVNSHEVSCGVLPGLLLFPAPTNAMMLVAVAGPAEEFPAEIARNVLYL